MSQRLCARVVYHGAAGRDELTFDHRARHSGDRPRRAIACQLRQGRGFNHRRTQICADQRRDKSRFGQAEARVDPLMQPQPRLVQAIVVQPLLQERFEQGRRLALDVGEERIGNGEQERLITQRQLRAGNDGCLDRRLGLGFVLRVFSRLPRGFSVNRSRCTSRPARQHHGLEVET